MTKAERKAKPRQSEGFHDHDARTAAYALANAFIWSQSPEGTEYWGKIYHRLCEIGEAKPWSAALREHKPSNSATPKRKAAT